MNDLIKAYNLNVKETEKLNLKKNKNFVESLEQYFEKNKKLTPKQENSFLNMIERVLEHNDLLNIKTTKETLVYKNYFRGDYHGDALQDSELYDIKRNLSEKELNEKIQDEHALQYGSESYISKYSLGKTVDFPVNLKNEKTFIKYKLENFQIALKKLKSNRFRKVSTKNRTIKILRELLSPNSDLFLSEEDESFLKGRYKF